MKTVLLIGIEGVHNYGCEAIVRGTVAILRSAWPSLRILYASRRPEDDARRLAGCEVSVVPRLRLGRHSPVNLVRKALRLAGIRWQPSQDSLRMLDGVDAVFSIGGDMYTLGPGERLNASLPRFAEAAVTRGIPAVLWGASVGPFRDHPQAERFYRRHLGRLSLITAREGDTVAYLGSLGVSSNVVRCGDPAYAVAPETVAREGARRGSTPTVAVNLSPLSVRHAGQTPEEVIVTQAAALQAIMDEHRVRLVLVPHVVSPHLDRDDDVAHLQRVRQAMTPRHRDGVDLVADDPGFLGVKRVLAGCDVVLAARMHCAINAMAAHVPTMLLSYSQKALGMCEYVYGHRRWVAPVDGLGSSSFLDTLGELISARTDVGAALSRRMPEIRADAHAPLKRLGEILKC